MIPGSGDNAPDGDEEQTERVPEVAQPPAVTEAPYVPSIVDTPGTNNVFVRGRSDLPQPEPGDVTPDTDSSPAPPAPPSPPREQPAAASADRPSLQKALFTYALPVVCAWFGSIVTDLF